MKGRNMLQRVTDSAQLGTESLPGRPIVELYSDCRVLIEVHRGIVEYGPTKIEIRVKYGLLIISGSCLMVCKMTANQLVISGKIDSIHILRGGVDG